MFHIYPSRKFSGLPGPIVNGLDMIIKYQARFPKKFTKLLNFFYIIDLKYLIAIRSGT